MPIFVSVFLGSTLISTTRAESATANLYIVSGLSSGVIVNAQHLLGGTKSANLLPLLFRARDAGLSVTSIAVGNADGDVPSSIDRIELRFKGSSAPFASATIAGCAGTVFEGNAYCAQMPTNPFTLNKDEGRDIGLFAVVKTDVNGAVSGEAVRLKLLEVRAVDSNGFVLSQNDEDDAAEGEVFLGTYFPGPSQAVEEKATSIVVGSLIKTIKNEFSGQNGAAVSAGPVSLAAVGFEAAVNANARGGLNRVVLDSLLFTIKAQNVFLADRFDLVNVQDPTFRSACTPLGSEGEPLFGDLTGIFYVRCDGLQTSGLDTSIPSGETLSLQLQGEVLLSAIARPPTLQAFLEYAQSPRDSFGLFESHIAWIDQDTNVQTPVFWKWYTVGTHFETRFRRFGQIDCSYELQRFKGASQRWGAGVGDPEYDKRYDLDGDGDIDALDLFVLRDFYVSCRAGE